MSRKKKTNSHGYEKVQNESDEENEVQFKIHIYKNEKKKIENWVMQYKNIETGGDLFGLWIDSQTAVVQLAIGPGVNCRRGTTSFYQDVNYLGSVGKYLAEKHGLCNLGQWHSHHKLSLNEPSDGDKNTVWGNMPKLGLKRYVVCIANITSSVSTTLNCYLFQLDDNGRKLDIIHSKFRELQTNSPLITDQEIRIIVDKDAEKQKHHQMTIECNDHENPEETDRLCPSPPIVAEGAEEQKPHQTITECGNHDNPEETDRLCPRPLFDSIKRRCTRKNFFKISVIVGIIAMIIGLFVLGLNLG